MTPVTGSSSIPQSNNQFSSPNQNIATAENEKKLVIEIKPGENNTSTGDRSNNSAKVTITGPNKELEAEITREQYYNTVERRTYKRLANQAFGGNTQGNPGTKAALAVKSGVVEGDNIESLAIAKNQKKQMETYMKASQNNPYNTSDKDEPDTLASDVSSVTTDYYEGVNKYAKQQFFFSKIDQISEKA